MKQIHRKKKKKELIRDGTVLINSNQGRMGQGRATTDLKASNTRKWLEMPAETFMLPREFCVSHHGVPAAPAHKDVFPRGWWGVTVKLLARKWM